MKTRIGFFVALCSFMTIPLFAQTTVFTYHGRLADAGTSATGIYDFRFAIYDAITNGNPIGSALTNSAIAASNGIFVTTLDLGASVFSGADRWLEIGVRTNGNTGAFQTLSPREQITSAPYAIRAANFGGTVSDSQLSANVARLDAASQVFTGAVNFSNASNDFAGSFSGSGAGLNHITLNALYGTNRSVIAWPTGGSATVIPPEAYDVVSVKAGLGHALALRNDGLVIGWGTSPGIILATATNVIAISAGGNHSVALKANGTVLVWGLNTFGQTNVPSNVTNVTAIACGNNFSLVLKADGSVVAWGQNSNGQTNVPPNATNVVAIGAGSSHALAVLADGSVIAWGLGSLGQTNVPADATNVIAVTGGANHSVALRADGTVVVWGNNAFGQLTIPPAATNIVAIASSPSSGFSTLALRADGAVLAWGTGNGGVTNVPAAASNVVAIAAGGSFALAVRAVNGTPPFALLDRPNIFSGGLTAPSLASLGALDISAGGIRVLRVEPDAGGSSAGNLIGGFVSNSVSSDFGPPYSGGNTIAGGGYSGGPNSIFNGSRGDFIGAGSGNQIGGNVNDSVIGGGFGNLVSASRSVIPGGYSNIIGSGASYSLAAGNQAQALHQGCFVWCDTAFGNVFASTAANQFSARASGGIRFVTSGAGLSLDGPITPSGTLTLAGDVNVGGGGGDYRHVQLGGGNASGYLYGSFPKYGDGIHLGYNFYADSIGGSHFANGGGGTSRISVGYNSIVFATGSAGVQPNYENVQIVGTTTTVNGTFNNNSDRNAKQDFKAVSPAQILDRVTQLPLSEWSYKEDAATRHIGPMAQDFHSAFNVGTDEKHIAPIDEGGVALAAIQGLNQKVEAVNAKLREENAGLKARLEKLERLIENGARR